MKISLFASSVRPQLYESFFKSLENEPLKDEIEVVFSGHCTPEEIKPFLDKYPEKECPNFKYIHTGRIKPSQNYELSRRACTGEVVVWVADDCLFPDGVIGKAYNFWKSQNNEKLVLSILTHERYNENYTITDLNVHTLKGRGTPLMAPIGMMSRSYLEKLGGYDARYCCGQTENDVVMRVYEDGGQVLKFEEAHVVIDHYAGHGGVTTEEGLKRPFGKGYPHDRKVLEGSWINNNGVSKTRLDAFCPFIDDGTLTEKSQYPFGEYWI